MRVIKGEPRMIAFDSSRKSCNGCIHHNIWVAGRDSELGDTTTCEKYDVGTTLSSGENGGVVILSPATTYCRYHRSKKSQS